MIFIFNTRTFWEEPPRARHQLARSLTKQGYEIFFIAKNKKGKKNITIKKVEKNIFLVQPSWYILAVIIYRVPIINEIYQKWLFSEIKKKIGNYIVVNFDPSAWLLFKYFNNVIYFCNDNFLALKRAKSFIVAQYHFFTQKYVIKKSVFTCGVSKYLYDYLIKYNSNTHLFLTAAPDIDFKLAKFNMGNIDKDKCTVVYVGWLTKIDVDLLQGLLEASNDLKIKVIGPGKELLEKIAIKYENIELLGEKKGEELYVALDSADVAIAPYILDDDVKKVYTMPNKFWLYLSFGLPIVTREILNLYELPEKFVYQSKNVKDFVNNVLKACGENSSEITNKRIEFAKKNTWDSRGEKFITLVNKYFYGEK